MAIAQPKLETHHPKHYFSTNTHEPHQDGTFTANGGHKLLRDWFAIHS